MIRQEQSDLQRNVEHRYPRSCEDEDTDYQNLATTLMGIFDSYWSMTPGSNLNYTTEDHHHTNDD